MRFGIGAELRRFRSFLAQRGHTRAWPPSRLWLALEMVQRLRYPGQPREGGRFSFGKMAPDTGGGAGGEAAGEAGGHEGPVTREQAARELHQKKADGGTQGFFLRCAELVKTHLAKSGLKIDRLTRSASSASVYLKRGNRDVGRIADHVSKAKSWAPPTTPTLHIRGKSVSRTKVNEFIAQILAKHGS